MQVFKMDVSKTIAVKGGKNYREKVGDVEVTTPTLEDIAGIVATAKIDSEAMAKEKKDNPDYDGLPIYTDPKADWIFGAIVAMVKANARNKLQPGSVELKSAENPIPTDWDGILATGTRGPNAALAILREVKALWAEFVAKLGKTEATTAMLILYFNNKQALLAQPLENRQKMLGYITDFVGTLSEDDAEKYQRPLDAIIAACNEGIATGNDF